MPLYRIGKAAELLGVSADTVRRWADSDRLATERTTGGQRLVDGADLARLARSIAADNRTDIDWIQPQSARNRFSGLVTNVVIDRVAAQVEIQAGPHRVVSLMTAEAARELGLEPGMAAVAAVKATNVIIELPPQP